VLCLNVYRKGNISPYAIFYIFNPLIRADVPRYFGGETIHEKDSKIEKSRKSLSLLECLGRSWCRNNCVVDYNNDQNIVLSLHDSGPEIIQICKFICFKIIKEFQRCQKHKKNSFVTYWLRLDEWRNKKV
jgi:hypothetical protein